MNSKRPGICLPVLICAVFAEHVFAQQEVVAQQNERIEEILTIGRQEFVETEFTARRTGSNVDAARLMTQVPGGAAASNGPLSGQIQYRGMYGPRINVRVDGMLIHGGGPNWMAPPLHHIPPGLMEEIVVEQGIASIATGGGIGGAATALWKRPAYNGDSGWTFSGDAEATFGTVDGGSSFAGLFGISSANHRLYGVGSFDDGDDYESARGTVAATRYSREVHGFGYGFRSGPHEIDLHVHRIDTDDTGTPGLPMDIDWFETEVWNAAYTTDFNGVGLELRIYGSEIDHGMSNFLLRPTPDFSSLPLPPFIGDDKRFVNTGSEESGFKLSLNWRAGGGLAIAGIEGKDAIHEATVTDPDFAPFFVNNFADNEVESLSLFAQWSRQLNDRWYVEAGVRSERLDMDSGEVDAFPARLVDANPERWPPGTPPRAVWALRQGFNAADRSHRDNNLDWVVKTRYRLSETLVMELGYAQKTRSPLYQERYLWIPLEANAGIGDGNNYVGNLELDPEQSRQLELGFDWDFGNYYISPRVYRRNVDDYIQGVAATNRAVVGVSRNANGDPTPLRFANTEATFRGIELSFGAVLDDNWRVAGFWSQVEGEREDVDDHLYRIAPPRLHLSLFYENARFTAKLEQVFVSEQDDLSSTNTLDPMNPNNSFITTDDYSLTNLYLSWALNDGLTLSAGGENLFDEDHVDHLTGFNRVLNSVVPQGSRMFGHGRNLFARFQYQW